MHSSKLELRALMRKEAEKRKVQKGLHRINTPYAVDLQKSIHDRPGPSSASAGVTKKRAHQETKELPSDFFASSDTATSHNDTTKKLKKDQEKNMLESMNELNELANQVLENVPEEEEEAYESDEDEDTEGLKSGGELLQQQVYVDKMIQLTKKSLGNSDKLDDTNKATAEDNDSALSSIAAKLKQRKKKRLDMLDDSAKDDWKPLDTNDWRTKQL